MNKEQENTVLKAVKIASTQWQQAFNSGSAIDCATHYEDTAIMYARPFGTFTGVKEIEGFWQKLIDDGFCDVEYIEPKINVIDEKSAILTSRWKMNNAKGIIHKELWVIQNDGIAKLREDDFEAES